MNSRQQNLLAEVVRSYIKKAEPVSSKDLEHKLGVSSATIRNEMAELEELGYLWQPHTSAGRQPTLKAYSYYVANVMSPLSPKTAEQKALYQVVEEYHLEPSLMMRWLGKQLAKFSGQAAVIGFTPQDVYYTGLANLFDQPEFNKLDMVRAISSAIDQLDESMKQLYQTATDQVMVKIGEDNPFGRDCAVICVSYNLKDLHYLFGLLGPLRMDYDLNVGRLEYVKRFFN